MDAVEVEVGRLVQLATENAILLPTDYDPFELLVHPNGTWELITLDLWQSKIGVTDKYELLQRNLQLGQEFIRILKELRNLL